jgi:uncharacterized surface protein with fasciclin (FAS1) repeats
MNPIVLIIRKRSSADALHNFRKELHMSRSSVAATSLAALLMSFLAQAVHADGTRNSKYHVPENAQVARVQGTIVDVAVGNPAFSTLVTALQAANLVTTLQGKGPFTVFAPTNDAFAKIPPALLNFLLANPEQLTSVLLYHVTPGIKDVRFQYVPRDVATVQGQDVYADREGDDLLINNAKVTGRVLRTDNGVIYVIDSVLLPQYR